MHTYIRLQNTSYIFSRKWIRPLASPSRTNSASSSLSTASLSCRIFSNDCLSLSFFFGRLLPCVFSGLRRILDNFCLPLILSTHVGRTSMPLFIKGTSHAFASPAKMIIALAAVLFGALQLHAAYSSSAIYASYRLAVASRNMGYVRTSILDVQQFQINYCDLMLFACDMTRKSGDRSMI